MAIRIYCEGEYDLQIFKQFLPSPIIITGGKKGMKAFAQGHSKGVLGPNGHKIIIRDKDFDYPLEQKEEVIKKEISNEKGEPIGYEYILHRMMIENYLISAESLFEYSKTLSPIPPFFETLESTKEIVARAASDLIFYSAVRHSLGKTRQPIDLKTTWTGESGKLPTSLDELHCKEQGNKLVLDYCKTVGDEVSVEVFEIHYQDFLKIFQEPSFITNAEYLIFFNGKDLGKQIEKLAGTPKFSIKRFYENYALKHFDYKKFPDLVQLEAEISQLSKI